MAKFSRIAARNEDLTREVHQISYLKGSWISKDLIHKKAGILALSKKARSSNHTSFLKSKEDFSNLHQHDLASPPHNPFQKKANYYNDITLKSENNYLRSYIGELEDDLQRLYGFNEDMVQVNKKLQQRISYYQEKSKSFIGDYESIMLTVNSIFKKTEDYLVSSDKVTNNGPQQRNSVQNLQELNKLVKLKLNFLFSAEMDQLKQSFETLQKKFYDLTSQTFTLQPFSSYIDSFQSSPAHSDNSSNLDFPRESSKSPVPSSTERSYNSYLNRLNTLNDCNTTVLTQSSNIVTQRSHNKPPISLREHKASRTDSISKEANLSFNYKPPQRNETVLNTSIVERLHTMHTTIRPTLKDRIEDLIKPAISTNHSRHNSLSYFTSASHPGASTRCSSTKASNQSNMISPTSTSIIIADPVKEKNLADYQKKEVSREPSRQNTPNRIQTSYTKVQVLQRTTQPERPKTSTRIRVNEILSSNKENSCCNSNSFTIPTLDIKNIVVASKENSRRSIQNREPEPQPVQKSPQEKLSTRDAYSHLKSFRRLVKDFHANPVAMPYSEHQIDEKNLRSSRGSILKRTPLGFGQK